MFQPKTNTLRVLLCVSMCWVCVVCFCLSVRWRTKHWWSCWGGRFVWLSRMPESSWREMISKSEDLLLLESLLVMLIQTWEGQLYSLTVCLHALILLSLAFTWFIKHDVKLLGVPIETFILKQLPEMQCICCWEQWGFIWGLHKILFYTTECFFCRSV